MLNCKPALMVACSTRTESAYQIGMDFAEPFNTRSFSSGVVGVRCRDICMPRSKLAFCAPLAIILGPKAPQDMAPYPATYLQGDCNSLEVKVSVK
jgi:hypothetical protein